MDIAEQQFVGTIGKKRAFEDLSDYLLAFAREWLHYVFKCLFPFLMPVGIDECAVLQGKPQ